MTFLLGVRIQMSALCFLILVIIDFVRSQRIRLLSTRIFSVVLALSAAHVAAEIATVYTIINMQDSIWNYIAHRVYYSLLLGTVFAFSAYVEVVGNARNEKISKLSVVAWLVPLAACLAGIFVCGINYVADSSGVYSSGAATNMLYIGIGVYTLVIFVETFRYKAALSQKKRFALRMQIVIWLMVFIAHILNNYLVLSSLAISMSVVALYFSFENPNENIDENTGAFNMRAFSQMFYEKNHCIGAKPLKLTALVIDDEDICLSSMGFYRFEALVRQAAQRLGQAFGKPVYRLRSNMLAVMFPADEDGFDENMAQLERKMECAFTLEDASIELKTHVVVLDCPEVTSEPSEVTELINCGSAYGGTGFVRTADCAIVEKKKRADTLNRMLAEAIENDGFEVVYQPIYSTRDKAFISSEALVRLKDKTTLGFVSPEEFIPLAEKNGFIIRIGEIVFEKVCAAVNRIRSEGLQLGYVEVNLSALQSIDESVPEIFRSIMKRHSLEPSSFNLEITETTAVESAALLEKNMARFRSMGCSFSMDDFGTGYSNLSKMAEVNYDLIKFDKSLIWPSFGEDRNEKSAIILANTVSMVSSLGAHIVAEGVETQEMADELTRMGVDYLQGYYYSRPISEDDYVRFLREHSICA